jgi:hypothetical protein
VAELESHWSRVTAGDVTNRITRQRLRTLLVPPVEERFIDGG